jgi:hypothetical protein
MVDFVSPFHNHKVFPPGYDHNLCHELLNLVRRASKQKETPEWVVEGGGDNAIVASDGSFWGIWRMLSQDTMAIAFRGTQTGADWNSNAKYYFTQKQCRFVFIVR